MKSKTSKRAQSASTPKPAQLALIDDHTGLVLSDSGSFPGACSISDSELPSDYWNLGKDSDLERLEIDGNLFKERYARRIAAIERRLGPPSIKDRSWYRVTEVVEHSLGVDRQPQDEMRLFKYFVSAVEAGIFVGGPRDQSHILFLQPDPQFATDAEPGAKIRLYRLRLTEKFLRTRRELLGGSGFELGLPSLLASAWLPRAYVVPWLRHANARIPVWFGEPAESPAMLSAAPAEVRRPEPKSVHDPQVTEDAEITGSKSLLLQDALRKLREKLGDSITNESAGNRAKEILREARQRKASSVLKCQSRFYNLMVAMEDARLSED